MLEYAPKPPRIINSDGFEIVPDVEYFQVEELPPRQGNVEDVQRAKRYGRIKVLWYSHRTYEYACQRRIQFIKEEGLRPDRVKLKLANRDIFTAIREGRYKVVVHEVPTQTQAHDSATKESEG